jgi:hypothetical protein
MPKGGTPLENNQAGIENVLDNALNASHGGIAAIDEFQARLGKGKDKDKGKNKGTRDAVHEALGKGRPRIAPSIAPTQRNTEGKGKGKFYDLVDQNPKGQGKGKGVHVVVPKGKNKGTVAPPELPIMRGTAAGATHRATDLTTSRSRSPPGERSV